MTCEAIQNINITSLLDSLISRAGVGSVVATQPGEGCKPDIHEDSLAINKGLRPGVNAQTEPGGRYYCHGA